MTVFHTGDSVVLLRAIKTGASFRRQTVVPRGAVGVVVRAPFFGRATVVFGVGGGLQQFTVIDADIESKPHLMPDDLAQLHPRGVGVP